MSSPVRSVAVRLSMDPSSYIAGATRAERSTLALDRAVSQVGPHTGTSMEKAAAGAGKAEGAFGKAQKSAGALGFTLGGLAGAGAAVAVGMSVKWAGDYQSALTRLATTAGESQKNLGMIGKGMLDMAGQVGIGAEELAKGMYTVDSAGIHGADSLIVLKAAAQGAKQENADLAHVVDAVTTSLHDYHLPASDAAKVTSQLIAAVSSGKTTFDELTGAMHSVEPIAASAGLSIAQTAGALAAMTASGMHADQAAQNLASSIRSFEKPTGTMRDELYQLGLDAQDLSAHLGQRGIAGTLQMVSDAIVHKMGPAGQVALDSLNKNKAAAQDLVIMMKSMTPEVAKLSSGLLDGSVSVTQYQKAAKGLGGQNAAMALQFLSLYKSSAGFSQILKTGGPAVQTYIGALGKAVGTAEGLSVALQLTGENATGTNKAIHAVATAAAQADGSIRGWDEVQHNFNQRLAEAEQGAKSLAIEAGQHLLPILTNGLGWIHDNGPAALHALGAGFDTAAAAAKPLIAAGGGVVSVFKGLPGPMQEAVLALVAFKAASAMGFLDKPKAAVVATRTAFAGLREEMTLQQALFAADQRSAALLGAEYGSLEARLGGLTAAEAVANGGLSRLGAGGATVAARGLSALKTAGSGALAMLGGPWGVAMIGATVGIAALTSMIEHHNAQIKADTQSVTEWQKQIQFGGVGAADAAKHLDDLRQKIADNQKAIDGYNAAAARGSGRGGIGSLVSQQKDLKSELDKGTKAWQDQLANMTPVEVGTQRVAEAQRQLSMALKDGNPDKIRAAYTLLTGAQTYLAGETNKENTAQMTQNQLLEKAATDALSSRDAALGLHMGQLQLNDSIAQLNAGMKDGTLKGNALAEAQLGLAQQAKQVADQAGRAAAAIATQNGETDTGTTSNLAMLASLKETARHLSGPALDAVNGYIKDLERTTSAATFSADKVSKLGVTVKDLPDGHFILINAPTAKQEADLRRLGYVTATLPDGHVVVTADVNPAEKEIRDMLNWARVQSIVLRAGLPDLNGSAPGSGRPGMATGGLLRGPGTGTSDSIPIMGSDGEFMVKASATAKHLPLLQAINNDQIPGYADGGIVVPTSIDTRSIAAMHSQLSRASAAYTASMTTAAGSGVERLRPIVDNVLRMLRQPTSYDNGVLAMISHESGGQSAVVNRTDSNWLAGHPSVGDLQVIAGTFARYAGPYRNTGPFLYGVSTNDTANIYAGTNYALQRYGPGILASGGRHSAPGHYIGYKTGTDYVPADGPAYLHKGERVVTAEANTAIRSVERAGHATPFSGGQAVVINIEGAQLSGTLAFNPSGMVELVDARIVSAVTTVNRGLAARGVR